MNKIQFQKNAKPLTYDNGSNCTKTAVKIKARPFFFKTVPLRSILTLAETETGKKSHNIKNCKSFNNFKVIEITFLKSILNKSA